MKRKHFVVTLLLGSLFLFQGCAQLQQILSQVVSQEPETPTLTLEEVVNGLKEALTVGADNSVNVASKTDGFFKNPELFIPFPPEAIKVKEVLEKAGLKKPVNDFVLSLNRAAEDASKRAFPIFKKAIIEMTFTDAMGILKGNETAATDYLKAKTTQQLIEEFAPIARQSIEKVQVTSYWNPIVTNYNRITFITGGEEVNPNLEEYITEKTIDGLFLLVAEEEALIRKDPVARITDLLKKVFSEEWR